MNPSAANRPRGGDRSPVWWAVFGLPPRGPAPGNAPCSQVRHCNTHGMGRQAENHNIWWYFGSTLHHMWWRHLWVCDMCGVNVDRWRLGVDGVSIGGSGAAVIALGIVRRSKPARAAGWYPGEYRAVVAGQFIGH